MGRGLCSTCWLSQFLLENLYRKPGCRAFVNMHDARPCVHRHWDLVLLPRLHEKDVEKYRTLPESGIVCIEHYDAVVPLPQRLQIRELAQKKACFQQLLDPPNERRPWELQGHNLNWDDALPLDPEMAFA